MERSTKWCIGKLINKYLILEILCFGIQEPLLALYRISNALRKMLKQNFLVMKSLSQKEDIIFSLSNNISSKAPYNQLILDRKCSSMIRYYHLVGVRKLSH